MTQMKTLTVNGTTYAVTDAAAQQAIGNLSQLNTVNKTNLTQAINETLAQGAPAIICTASGTCICVNDAATRRMQQLRLFGKTTLAGTPSRDNPASMTGIGDICLTITGTQTQSLSLTQMPLCGIAVTSGGNYTDENGQMWLCDEIDLMRGVYIRRVGELILDGTENFSKNANNQFYLRGMSAKENTTCLCTHFKGSQKDAYLNRANTVNFAGTIFWLCAEFESAAALKSYLAAQYAAGTPVKVQYAMATPAETPLPEQILLPCAALHTEYPDTQVQNDAGAYMTLGYVADPKRYIDNALATYKAVSL